MCLNLLRTLSEAPLPCTRADAAMIDRLRLLDAADLISVLIPPVRADCDHGLRQDAATVLEITPHGWEALRTNRVEDEMPLPLLLWRSRQEWPDTDD